MHSDLSSSLISVRTEDCARLQCTGGLSFLVYIALEYNGKFPHTYIHTCSHTHTFTQSKNRVQTIRCTVRVHLSVAFRRAVQCSLGTVNLMPERQSNLPWRLCWGQCHVKNTKTTAGSVKRSVD